MSIDTILDGGLESAGIVLILVISFKIYKAKITQDGESNCGKFFKWKLHSENPGGDSSALNNVV